MLRDENRVRVAHGMQTLGCVLQAVFHKHISGYHLIQLTVGFDAAEQRTRELLGNLAALLRRDDAQLVALAFQVLRVVLTAFDNVAQNTFVEYLLAHDTTAPLLETFATRARRDAHGYDVLVILALLINYRKYEVGRAAGVG